MLETRRFLHPSRTNLGAENEKAAPDLQRPTGQTADLWLRSKPSCCYYKCFLSSGILLHLI